MKKYYCSIVLLLMAVMLIAQPGKKAPKQAKAASQNDIDKMMEDAMKGMSAKEKAEIKQAMGQATQIAGQLKQQGFTAAMGSNIATEVPPKQASLLNKIPLINSKAAYKGFINARVADCKKNMPPALIKEIDDYFLAKANDPTLLNFAPFLLVQQKPSAAVYAALKLVALHPDNFLLSNNLGVVFHQVGYAEMAIPVFQYLVTNRPYAEIDNNLAQAYLSLGDMANAMKFFRACIAKNPDHPAAHAGLGLILAHEGNMAEATIHITQSLKNRYSETAEAVAKKHKMNIRYADIKPVVADYFNPQKFKPVPPATNEVDIVQVDRERNELNELYQDWMRKSEALSSQQEQQKDSETVSQLAYRYNGYFSKAPLAKKAAYITDLLTEDYYNFLKQQPHKIYETRARDLYQNFEAKIDAINKEPFQSNFKDCQKKLAELKSYLALSAANHQAYQRKILPPLYDWMNQNLEWKRYLLNGSEYKQHMYELIKDFFRILEHFKQGQQIDNTAMYVASQCKGLVPPDSSEVQEDSIQVKEADCPIKIEVPFGVGKAKYSCKGYEIEGGELIVGGVEKNFATGEFTLFLGLGFGEYAQGLGIGGVESGAKIGSFVTVGKDWTIIDCGNKAEAGIEGGVGPFITEVKISGTMGMESGINVDGNVLGTETKIFQY